MKAAPNRYVDNNDGTTTIFVSKMNGISYPFTIDTVDVPLVNNRSWCVNSYGYLVSGNPTIYMHRFLLGIDGSELGDHRNADRSDNRRSNLRVTDHAGNNQNSENRNTSTGIKGVCIEFHKKSGLTYVKAKVRCPDGKRRVSQFSVKAMGLLEAVAAASMAVREMREKHHGEFARHG